MGTKELHELYKSQLNSLFSDKFKSDLINIVSQIYGEEFREKFEKNMSKIVLHSKFNLDNSFKYNYTPQTEKIHELESSLKETLENARNEKNQALREAKKKLILNVKSDLSDEEKANLQTALDSYSKEYFAIDEIAVEFEKFFGNYDLGKIYEIIQEYKLTTLDENTQYDNPAINAFLSTQKQISINYLKQISNYEEFAQEFQDVELEDFDLLDEILTNSAGQIYLKNKKTGEKESHIIMSPYKEKDFILGTLTHEILHALEVTEIENGLYKTGFSISDDSDGNRETSECIHTVILFTKIYPALNALGYKADDFNRYVNLTKDGYLGRFMAKFENAILRSRCQPDLHELYDVVGKDNFQRLVEAQNTGEYESQVQILKDMEEHSRLKMPERIGKYTLPVQENIKGKEAISNELSTLLVQERGEITNAD